MLLDFAAVLQVALMFSPSSRANSDEGHMDMSMYEEDIMMNAQQETELFGGHDVTRQREKRSIRKGGNYRWQMPIRYIVDEEEKGFNASERYLLQRALREWQKVTCVRFSELPPGLQHNDSFVIFRKEYDSLCTSFVGDQEMTEGQHVLLGSRCFEKIGRLLHELGHLLGLLHEHMRSIRDDYVVIRAPEGNVNFKKAETETQEDFGVPYDFNSVMHYPLLDTKAYELKPKDFRYDQNIGQRSRLSFLDARKINLAYCAAACGGHMYLNDYVSSHVLWSPGYFHQSGYRYGSECNWIIKSSNGSRISLTFRGSFSIHSDDKLSCDSWVEVKVQGDFTQPGFRFCGKEVPSRVFTSVGTELSVVFKSSRVTSGVKSRENKSSRVTSGLKSPEKYDEHGVRENKGFLAYIWLET